MDGLLTNICAAAARASVHGFPSLLRAVRCGPLARAPRIRNALTTFGLQGIAVMCGLLCKARGGEECSPASCNRFAVL